MPDVVDLALLFAGCFVSQQTHTGCALGAVKLLGNGSFQSCCSWFSAALSLELRTPQYQARPPQGPVNDGSSHVSLLVEEDFSQAQMRAGHCPPVLGRLFPRT